MKKVLVTGANGFLGGYLTEALSQQKNQVYAVVRNKESEISAISNLPGVQVIYCDLSEMNMLPERMNGEKIDTFYHLAWAGSSGALQGEYSLQMKNVTGACAAAEAAVALNSKCFIGAGSVIELRYRDYLPRADARPKMNAIYAIAKMTANYMCKCICHKNGLRFNWGYVPNMYGVGDTSDNIVNSVVKSYLRNQVPSLTPGEQNVDFVYVSDVATALLAIGEKGVNGVGYYIGGSQIKPLKEFVTLMRDEINKGLETGLGKKEYVGEIIDFEKIDVNRLFEDTGVKPVVTFEKGLSLLHHWLADGQ